MASKFSDKVLDSEDGKYSFFFHSMSKCNWFWCANWLLIDICNTYLYLGLLIAFIIATWEGSGVMPSSSKYGSTGSLRKRVSDCKSCKLCTTKNGAPVSSEKKLQN